MNKKRGKYQWLIEKRMMKLENDQMATITVITDSTIKHHRMLALVNKSLKSNRIFRVTKDLLLSYPSSKRKKNTKLKLRNIKDTTLNR